MIGYAPSIQRNVRRMLQQVAEEHKISYQKQASAPYSGTDTDAFAYAGQGTASALLSLPVKYMHSTVEMAAVHDMNQLIELLYRFMIQLPEGHDFSYFKDA